MKEDVEFRQKTTGLEKYDFEPYASTEVEFDKIDLKTKFFSHEINFPFLISCMTGGSRESVDINSELAAAANELKIPIGVGSQRQALENDSYHQSYKIIREKAPDVPVLSNIGASEFRKLRDVESINKIIDMIEADAFVIHLNSLQELLQPEGNPNFSGLFKNIARVKGFINIPVIVKEVGAGIGKRSAKDLLEAGADGIDVAGAGGTSWAAVELLRTGRVNEPDSYFRDWGIPTAECIEQVSSLKTDYNFTLIASGGLKDFEDIAKSLALGADITASANALLQIVVEEKAQGIISHISGIFEIVKKIMYLTGCSTLNEFRRIKPIIKKNK
jgi:isopentenyl-diphosphate delta-isomerase